MVFSEAPDFNIVNLSFYPEEGKTFIEELNDCYSQFTAKFQNRPESKKMVLKQTIFISAKNHQEYLQIKQKLFVCAKLFFDELPPTSIIAQTPANESLVLEVSYIEGAKTEELIHKKHDQYSWIVFTRDNLKMVVTAGLGESNVSDEILQQSINAFEQLRNILQEENMEFSDVVRQWNYIKDITGNIIQIHQSSQHYQVFNDIRSKYYQPSKFANGYPAATGIGMEFGGVMIDAFAFKTDQEKAIVPVKSPVQLDAHRYSAEVLADNHLNCDLCQTTPKFERAKMVNCFGNRLIFISGTAAIVGQESAASQSVETQTEMTIQNIQRLISSENLREQGISADQEAVITHLRVYVKLKGDIQKVKEVCQKYFSNIPISYVVADVCRPELLVEIEGQAVLN
jgi:enamine deaminase RidA (YjgF/YER057c/UK114 family)